jgi:hypothetical protein
VAGQVCLSFLPIGAGFALCFWWPMIDHENSYRRWVKPGSRALLSGSFFRIGFAFGYNNQRGELRSLIGKSTI